MIQQDDHLLTVMRYVEANPLRARMVSDLASYPWSSYIVHGLGRRDALVDEAPVWPALATTEAARQAFWRLWLHTPLTERELSAVRRSLTTGRPFGDSAWAQATASVWNKSFRAPARPSIKTSGKMN